VSGMRRDDALRAFASLLADGLIFAREDER
jgi:hypothetical protein